MVTRRRFLRSTLAVGAIGSAGCAGNGSDGSSPTITGTADEFGDASGSPTPSTDDGFPVQLQAVARGFTSPIDLAFSDDSEIYVADQPGIVYRAVADDSPVFLDLREQVVEIGGYSERGLLGLTLHPNFSSNRRFYVRYSAPRRSDTPSNFSHTFVLSEFRASDDGLRGRPDSERTILELPQPQANHNAGAIAFGPDGYLYVGTGDGGAANDTGTGHVDDWYDRNAGGNGQDITANLLGSILRIDVEGGGSNRAYGIPEDNPLVGRAGLDEQYAWGFRNPWRFSFTDEELFVADVGQNRFEEVNLVESGGNYGWNVREGAHCFGPDQCPTTTNEGQRLIDPIIEYPHSGEGPSGIAVIGGYLYTGEAIPGLQGQYVFGDWQANGRLFVATRRDRGRWATRVMEVANSQALQFLLAFGRGSDGELYACTSGQGRVSGQSGGVYRLQPS
jgi:glucose/arabinose dehydrogenase